MERQAKLPAAPGVLARVVQLCADPDAGVREVSRALSSDPAVTAKVLWAVNSGYYSPRSPITTVDLAVSFLGMRAVRNLVVCFVLQRLTSVDDIHGFSVPRFWEGSLRRAVAARRLAIMKSQAAPDELFAVGMMQDLGVLLQLADSDALGPFFSRIQDSPYALRLDMEREVGDGHDELGAELLQNWQLPQDLVEPVRYHHAPAGAPDAHRQRAMIANVAESVADLHIARDIRTAILHAEVQLGRLDLDPKELGGLVDSVAMEVAEAASLFQLVVGSQPSYEELLFTAAEAL